jgi:hypothetical protein
VNVATVLEMAEHEINAALERTDLQHLVATPEDFWGQREPQP